MFPSGNYFRDIPCPFYSRVSCPRPHCHFKHVQTSSLSLNSPNPSTQIHIPPDANETLNKLINQLSTVAGTNHTPTPTVDFASILQSTLLQSLTTVFTNALSATPPTVSSNDNKNSSEAITQAINTISTQISQQQQQQQTSSISNSNSTVPQYKPTPIAELERRKRSQQNNLKDLDDDDYIQATFSPPSNSPPHSSSSVSVVSKSVENDHSWVSPPERRKVPSSTDQRDLHQQKGILTNKSVSQPTKTSNGSTVNSTSTRIPKKTRLAEIDIDRVPVTPSLSLDADSDHEQKSTSKPVKRPSNGTNEIPAKKTKISPLKKPSTPISTQSNMKRSTSIQNGSDEKDAELALFDSAFSVPKKTTPLLPLSSSQQIAARYSSMSTSNSSQSTIRTRAETATDGRRIAHQPKIPLSTGQSSSSTVFQPLIDSNSSSSKVPLKTRQQYLNFFLDELKKQGNRTNSNVSSTSMSSRAQLMEKEIFDKSTNRNTYSNLAANFVRQIRSDDASKSNESTVKKVATPQRMIVSHSAILSGAPAENVSYQIKKQKQIDIKTLADWELYTLFLKYKASEEDRIDNGYPAFSLDFPDKVLIKNRNPIYNPVVKLPSSDPNSRQCSRCSKTYKVNEDGEYLSKEECIHHWGRIRTQRISGQITKTFSCCGLNSDSVGCSVAQCHVHNGDDSQLLSGYIKTQPLKKTTSSTEFFGIFALDCEMCYTTNGLELVRVSVVNHKLQPVFESFVKPHATILDYNTRWSGITETDLEKCSIRLEDIQKSLVKLFNEKSILIGHSLDSDLKALKIVHETIIDTSLVFPHAKGKPYKRALKTLTSEYLNKTIQDNAKGHDSMEDSLSCMELMLWKVKEDLRTASGTH